jgi:hypothetical protein
MTDQKSQGKQFSDVLVNHKGVHSSGTATRPSFMSLYVQLSRAKGWDGLHLFRKPARGDFIEPKNVLDKDMRDAILKLERRGGDQTAVRTGPQKRAVVPGMGCHGRISAGHGIRRRRRGRVALA